MAAPNVSIREQDISTRVPEFPGVYGCMVVDAPKGPVLLPTLVTSEADLLRIFTPNEWIESNYSLGFYSALAFLQKSNKLWVIRPNLTALHGGVILKASTAATANEAITTGLAEYDDVIFNDAEDAVLIYGANPGAWNNDIAITAYTKKAEEVAVLGTPASGTFTVAQDWETGYPVQFAITTGGDFPGGMTATATYYTIRVSANTVKVALTLQNALAGTAVSFTDAGTGELRIRPYQDYVKEADSFLVNVYKKYGDDTDLVESWTCSRKQGKKDGFGKNIFVDTVLQGSNFIRGYSNPMIADTVDVKGQLSKIFFEEGTDGNQATTADFIFAADTMSNKNTYPLTLFMDAGQTDPTYQSYLTQLCEARFDSMALLSTPYDKEATANYLNDIVDYRKNILNVSSSFAALYTPHVKIYDKYNDRSIFVAPDGYAGAAISATASNYEIWYPAAGFRRGMLLVNDLRRRFTGGTDGGGEMGLLYDAGINPLRYATGRGIMIWGQKTLLSRPSALDRINVRCMLLVVEPAIQMALEDFLFEMNDSTTRSIVVSMLTDYMNGIKARRGVYDYMIICDSTNNTPTDVDNHKMNVAVFVKPTHSIEYIPCTVVITRTGMDFKLAASSLGISN